MKIDTDRLRVRIEVSEGLLNSWEKDNRGTFLLNQIAMMEVLLQLAERLNSDRLSATEAITRANASFKPTIEYLERAIEWMKQAEKPVDRQHLSNNEPENETKE